MKVNEPVMDGVKTCIRCGEEKHVTAFHAHKYMKDGRLNKCAVCVKAAVDEWRQKKPDARKLEHKRNAERKGIKPRDQYLQEISANAMGRKIVSLKYFHKRRAQQLQMPVWDREFDELAFEEAKALADARTAITGFAWSVDHIVPINHRQATGLHNGFNLNVAPAVWNSSKANRHMSRYFGK
jgi:hypothetical protein